MSTSRPTPVEPVTRVALGRHLLVDLYGCTRELLNDVDFVRQRLLAAAEQVGATVVDAHFHSFSPCGVTGTVSIQESHLSVHTWPEHLYAAIDIFTCGDAIDPWLAYESLKAALEAERGSAMEIHRGRPDLL
jgi:spermidine synthase